MAYVTPGTVAAGDVATAAAWNVITNDVIDNRAVLANVKSTTVTNITTSTTSTSFVDITGLSVSITPTSATSLILVWFSAYFGANAPDLGVQLLRGATVIGSGSGGSSWNTIGFVGASAYSTPANTMFHISNNFLDSPATTSATTYKLQYRGTGGTIYLNRRSGDTAYSASSTITVMEVPV